MTWQDGDKDEDNTLAVFADGSTWRCPSETVGQRKQMMEQGSSASNIKASVQGVVIPNGDTVLVKLRANTPQGKRTARLC